jgi:endogenous inhibitor of DNA gyrase (YacG/DUF329 family)
MKVKCPGCGKMTEYDVNNRYRPFCSERCSILDLGAWADEKFKIPAIDQESESVNENDDSESAPLANLPPRHLIN